MWNEKSVFSFLIPLQSFDIKIMSPPVIEEVPKSLLDVHFRVITTEAMVNSKSHTGLFNVAYF